MTGFQERYGRQVITKSVRSDLDYGIALRGWLVEGDAVSTSAQAVWTCSDGLQITDSEVVQDANRGPIAYVMLKTIGVDGSKQWARCVWTTDQGRTEQQTLHFNIDET